MIIKTYEGFDMVGKTTLAKKDAKSGIYKKIELDRFDKLHDLVPGVYDLKWAVYDTLYNTLGSIKDYSDSTVVIDRSFLTYLVYVYLYVPEWRKYLDIIIDNIILTNDTFINSEHIYVKHKNKMTAKIFYDTAIIDRSSSVGLKSDDIYEAFDDYWERYLVFDSTYMKFYDRLGIKPIIIENEVK